MTEEDKIIIDWCPKCGWRTPARKEADKLNDLAVERGQRESALIDFVRTGEWKESAEGVEELVRLCREARTAYVAQETQRVVAKITHEKERTTQ